MGYLSQTKWGVCSTCGGGEQDVVKVKKELYCIPCRNSQKAEEQIEKSKRRESAKRQGFKVRNELAAPRGSEDYFMSERQNLINDLDYVHSRLVRMMAANLFGMANCFTCGLTFHWSMMQLSHFVKRQNTLTRWDLRANRCACKHCNERLDGNLEVFAQRLNEEQSGLAEQLQEIAREPHKWSREELKQLLIDQRARLRIIETKFIKP